MAYSYTSLILQRVVLPIILVLASLYRPVGISFVYLLMFFISPFVPVASARNFKRSVTPYLIILIALSSLLILCHISLQLVLLIFSMDDVFGNCSFTEQLLRHIGFVDLRNLKATSVIEWLVPEVVVFVASVVIYCVIKKLVLSPHDVNKLEKGEGDISSSTPQTLSDPSGASILERPKLTTTRLLPEDPDFDKLIRFSPLLCIASLFFAAVLRPSVPGSLYFIIFLYVGTYWATMRSLGRVFSMVLRFIMVVIVLQILLTVAYQTPWVQQHLDKNNLIARLIGLEALVTSTCKDDIRVITYDITNYTTASYLSPVVLCLAFYTLALSTKNIRKKPVSLRRERAEREKISDPTETTPLVRSLRKSNPPVQTGSINDQPISSANIDMENLSDSSEEKNEDAPHSSVCDQITYGFISIGGFIYQNSYIFTNILMMAWSIIYHSWLTFVFLLWANLLWMIPNQRKAMMRSSPFIVLYAECLLIAQYIYGMDLNSDELPTKVNGTGINLGQIGFSRPLVPCIPLLIKSSFLLMFWVTLRQYIKEKKLLTGESRFTLFTPLGMGSDSTQKITSTFLKKLGEIFKSLLVRLWIWLLVLIIFLCAITGRHMTGFRICYMALFLFFLLVFQSSSKAWIKIMYGFWLFLIFYVMTILILIYTYQFDKFDDYWRDYINIPEKLQLDIGLERYKTKDLFLHLLSPTLIVILTVIQVHYFHKRFIAALEHKAVDIETFRRPRECLPNEADLETYVLAKGSEHRIRNMIFYYFKRLKIQFIWLFKTSKGVVWRLLELHILKLVYFTAFICCVSEVCLLHIIFVLLCLLGVCSNTSVSTFISRIISLLVSIIVLTKMMYQVAYLDHNRYDTNCTSIHHGNTTVNDAEWFGLKKELPEEGGLMKLLRLYIAYMIVVTLHAVVILRQSRMRTLTDNEGIAVLNVLFPSVTRADAEKNLNNMIKYLCNYGFYKFGLEITMIWLVSTITFRQDIVAFLYVFWLIIFLLLKRKQIAKIWVVFLWFVAAMIILQYILFVGLPPSLCIIYPWDDKPYYEALQRWAMLPGCLHLSHISKLIFDFVLLMFVNSQLRVFKIHSYRTSSPTTPQYPGGTNRSAVSDIEKLGEVPFVNPTRDFLSNVRNYLDIFLNIVFSGFFWITLAVVFVGGTNIHNFFALGYLIGAFVFLWEGSDFYLRPIKTIIRRWKWLVGYNVANIAIKTFSQIGGCMFLGYLRTNTCWLVHVLGISCMARPFINSPQSELAVDCPDAKAQSSILWDAICFAFLIFQLRIFKSHYFCHMILDTRANSILTSRGGDLIEDLRRKQIEYRQKQEHEVLLKIKKKMEKIRATQQKMLRPILKPTHFDAEIIKEETVKVAPLAHHSSFSLCAGSGYRTPDDDETASCTSASHSSHSDEDSRSRSDHGTPGSPKNSDGVTRHRPHEIRIEYADVASSDAQTDYGDVQSESDLGADHALRLKAPMHLELPDGGGNISPGQQPLTPNSDGLTLPFDGFLETNRLSIDSSANSDVLAMPLRDETTTEAGTESSNGFATTAYNNLQSQAGFMQTLMPPSAGSAAASGSLNVNVSRGSSVISSNLTTSGAPRHHRLSSINAAVSWNETVSIKKCVPQESTGSGDVSDNLPVTMRQKSLHRRHLSVGNATYTMGDAKTIEERRRRSSNVSWARTENVLRAAARPNSWGPVEHGNPVPASRPHKRKEPKLHAEAVRAGDYYMFEDMDDKFELDIIEDSKDFLEEQEQLTESEKKMNLRKTLFDVWKDISGADNRRQFYMRQRSYASAPGSHFDFGKISKKDFTLGGDTSESWEGTGNGAGAGAGAGNADSYCAGIRISTHSEPPLGLQHSKSEYFVKRADSIGSLKKKDDETEASARPEEGKVDHASEERTETDNSRRIEIEKQPGKDEDYGANPVGRLLEGLMVSLILRLNRFSRNYRYVNKILAEEKRMLKESDFLSRISKPSAASLFNVFRAPHHVDSMNDDTVQLNPGTSQNDITQLTAITPPTETNGVHTQSHDDSSIQQQNPEQIAHADHDIIELPSDTADAGSEATSVVATQKPRSCTWDLVPEIRINTPSMIRSREDSIALMRQRRYSFDDAEFAARDHHIVIEFIISLWYAILSNTDLLCYIVIFINQVSYASVLSLPLPTMVFLWGTLSLPRPTKTFWVTLIAYTQAIVLIKCIFQFKLIWAHYINIPNQPLTWEKILGVEERENYATVDLLVLLVLFFHRYILKSHGLWVSKEVDDEMFTADNNEVEEKDGKNKSDAYLATDESDFRDALSSQELTPENKTKDGTKYERPKGGMDQIQKVEDDDALSERSREKYIAGLQRLKRAKYFSSVRNFFYDLMNKARLPVDVYALMFLCDFINFFVLLFGFTSFSYRLSELDSGGVETYFSENKIPIPFLIMLLVQFLLIVIDRALYLRKALIPKIVFHYFSVIGVHIWMFFIVPYVTERSFHLLAAPIIFYICKCFYLLLSSYQIKCGFPRRILGNFFTKSFSVVNMVALKIFMLIPFLYELRTVLDWLCTSTTMTLFDWLKMEGIYSEIFFIRCTRQLEQDFPALRSEKKQLSGKLLLGGTVILLIFLFIWGPLCIFALGKTVGVSNIPYEATVTIRIGPYDPVYHTSNRESIFAFGAAEYANMSNAYKTNREAIGFLTGYDAADIAAVKLAGNSPSLWTISPPDKERLLTDLKSNNTLIARFIYALTRHDSKGNAKTASSEVIFKMNSTYDGREALIKMIEGDQTDQKVTIPNFVPKFIKVPNTADVSIVTVLMPAKMQYRNLIMGIHNEVPGNLWWEIKEDCSDEFHRDVLHELPLVNCDSGLVMYTFNEKSFPKTIIWLTGAGIVGVYTTFVLLASRVLKGIASNIHHKTMFQDLPYVDRVLQLCLDIYLVREALEFTLEEDLFAKLIFLYRSPETLIKWTRPVEERNEDETDTESVPSRSSSRPLSERRQNEQQQQQQPPH